MDKIWKLFWIPAVRICQTCNDYLYVRLYSKEPGKDGNLRKGFRRSGYINRCCFPAYLKGTGFWYVYVYNSGLIYADNGGRHQDNLCDLHNNRFNSSYLSDYA